MAYKQVAIEIRIKTVVTVPEDWDDGEIQFFWCENHCVNNEIRRLADRDPEGICTLCNDAEVVILKGEDHPDLLERYRENPLYREPTTLPTP